MADDQQIPQNVRSRNKPAVALSYPPGLACGIDEAGRGPLAGPVVAAAVLFMDHAVVEGLNDSKKLSAKRRLALQARIKEVALWSLAAASAQEIDQMNILQASLLAMRRAYDELYRQLSPEILQAQPLSVWVDGNQPPPIAAPLHLVVGGDGKIAAIAAASILAKTHRDQLMAEYDQQYPDYGFATHQGYPTAKHLAALQQHGPCPIHRLSFAPVRRVSNSLPGL